MFTLPSWGRAAVVTGALFIVVVSVVVVVCFVAQGCWLNSVFLKDAEEKGRKKKEKKKSLAGISAPKLSFTKYQEIDCSAAPPRLQRCQDPLIKLESTPLNGKMCPSPVGEKQFLLGALPTKRDSTYSSMSEQSGRTSPTNSSKSSVGSGGSSVGSPVSAENEAQITFSLQFLSSSGDAKGKLVIVVGEVLGLLDRDFLGGPRNSYVKIVLWKERRSLRKVRSTPLQTFHTKTVRRSNNPSFNQTFVVDVLRNELKEIVMKLISLDTDKWANPTALGEVIQPLREINNLPSCDQKTSLSFFLATPKLELGEVLFGLSYLPTAERLSVSVIKAKNLSFINAGNDMESFCPYIRVLLISGTGKLIKKKKTTFRRTTTSPLWNETLIFDLPQDQVQQVTFILTVCSRPSVGSQSLQRNDSGATDSSVEESSRVAQESSRKHDRYIGKVCLGCRVRSENEQQHWNTVLTFPRRVVSQWHRLK